MKLIRSQKNPPARKSWPMVLCVILMAAISVGVTLAYLASASDPVINTFQAGSVGADIYEEFDGSIKSVIAVRNTGKSPVYARVRLVSYYESSEGVVDASKGSPAVSFNCGTGWVEAGEYYYYTLPVGAGQSTTNLLDTNIEMEKGQVIEVLADTVQATPKDAVLAVWGVDPTTLK